MSALPALQAPPADALPSRAPARLELAPYDFAAALELERELGVSATLAQVLVRRGHRSAAGAREFLAADESHPPSAFDGIETAVATIMRHVEARSRITIHGDYDVDGVCSTAILVGALRGLGGEVDWFIPDRAADGYGLAEPTVRRLAMRGTRLLITADCGIGSADEIAAARAAGLDAVVTDHHAPPRDGRLPDAPIVHPAVAGYPCPDLCAAGVAHKLHGALLRAAGRDPAGARDDLDLVALATIADLVPLRGENRRLARDGLRALAVTPRPGLRALMRVARLDPSALDAGGVGFRLAPRINAAGRLRRADAGVELILTGDERRAEAIADELDSLNRERQLVERRITAEAEAQVRELGERPAYVLAAPGWHPGVVGIVASRIVERLHRPAILIALDPDAGEGTGSGRSIPGFDLLGALHACAEHLGRYGGHRAAAGLTVDAAAVDSLRAAFEAHADAALAPEDLVRRERVDAVAAPDELDLELADELARLEPCGLGNPAPVLMLAAARLTDPRPMGEGGRHLRFTVEAAGLRARAVSFGCDGRLPVDAGEPADATFRLERNAFNGAVEARLKLREARPCEPPAIEVVGEPPDYLAAVLAELDAPLPHAARESGSGTPLPGRRQVDRTPAAPGAQLAAIVSSGEPVLAVCADVPLRLRGLAGRYGGFALCSWHALARDPALAAGYRHVVAIDPPSCARRLALLGELPGDGFSHLAWGEAELAFVGKIHELELDLRAPLTDLYRALRDRGEVRGGELGALLGGDGPRARPAHVAGRLVRVLEELGLVSLDRAVPALAPASTQRTSLERSPAYMAYTQQYEDGQRFLKAQRHLSRAATRSGPSGPPAPLRRLSEPPQTERPARAAS